MDQDLKEVNVEQYPAVNGERRGNTIHVRHYSNRKNRAWLSALVASLHKVHAHGYISQQC